MLRAILPGTKRVRVTNVLISLSADVTFEAPRAGQSHIGLAADSRKLKNGNLSFAGSVGITEPGVKRSSGTYTFFGNIQGQEASR
ncbi:MAG: hypothetical protein EOP06_30075 [Proteobacteria bacterium]|nr:MAG: hypothetical protein EOP06_30075 [Pseudomonadota bacterium]